MTDHEHVGSLGDEAVKLLGALGDWAREQAPEPEPAPDPGPAPAPGGAACTWCPVCRTVHALRSTNPEVREQLLVAATALLQAGTGLLASLQAGPAGAGHPGPSPAPPGRVEHVDLSDEPDGQHADDDEWES